MLRLGWVVLGLVGLGVACEESAPCDDYVTYMCDCHGDEPGFDCDTLRQTYVDAPADVQDQCVIDLHDQQDQDEADGVCQGADTGDSGAG